MENRKSFQEVVADTRALIAEFEKREQKKWGIEGAMIELMKQVGELSRSVMLKEKYYPKDKVGDDNIGDELYDIFFMTVRIADHYGIDLEKECEKEVKYTMEKFSKELPA